MAVPVLVACIIIVHSNDVDRTDRSVYTTIVVFWLFRVTTTTRRYAAATCNDDDEDDDVES